jgi:creatinine amidohydrolase/Fe(II)-dependent formamide hydrolase-like protein
MLYLRQNWLERSLRISSPRKPFPDIAFGWAAQDLSENGVIGDPRQSNAEHGEKLFQLLVEGATTKLKAIAQS